MNDNAEDILILEQENSKLAHLSLEGQTGPDLKFKCRLQDFTSAAVITTRRFLSFLSLYFSAARSRFFYFMTYIAASHLHGPYFFDRITFGCLRLSGNFIVDS